MTATATSVAAPPSAMSPATYLLLADAVLMLHACVVAFVVGALVLVVWGNRRRWTWVNAPGFRIAHLAAILFVAAQAWLGVDCPLTTLEMALRARAGAPSAYDGGFIAHWLGWLLYYEAPAWLFVAVYTLFMLLALVAWWRYPPRFRQRRAGRRV